MMYGIRSWPAMQHMPRTFRTVSIVQLNAPTNFFLETSFNEPIMQSFGDHLHSSSPKVANAELHSKMHMW